MDKKYCHNCGRENDIDNEFCPGCGTKLFKVEEQKSGPVQNPPPPAYGYYAPPVQPIPPQEPPIIEEPLPEVDFDGVSNKELFSFTGSERIVNKFVSMQRNETKVSWCWSVAVLTFLLGFFGAAFWFMYRKMYKVAIIFIIIGVLFHSAGYAISGEVAEVNSFIALGQNMANGSEYLSDDSVGANELNLENLDALFNYEDANIGQMIYSLASFVSNITLMILCGLFSMSIYKNHCIKKVKAYREVDIEEKYYHHGLATVGGTIGTSVLLVVLGYIVIRACLIALFTVIFGV